MTRRNDIAQIIVRWQIANGEEFLPNPLADMIEAYLVDHEAAQPQKPDALRESVARELYSFAVNSGYLLPEPNAIPWEQAGHFSQNHYLREADRILALFEGAGGKYTHYRCKVCFGRGVWHPPGADHVYDPEEVVETGLAAQGAPVDEGTTRE